MIHQREANCAKQTLRELSRGDEEVEKESRPILVQAEYQDALVIGEIDAKFVQKPYSKEFLVLSSKQQGFGGRPLKKEF